MNKSVIAGAAAVVLTLGGIGAYLLVTGLAGTRASRGAITIQPIPPVVQPAAPPGAPPVAAVDYEPVAPQTAMKINDAVPVVWVGPPAQPFRIATGTPTWDRALFCLAQAVYYEAGAESAAGQRAVAQVVLNRVRSPAFPNSICGVVYQGAERATGCQFTFTCDGSLRRVPSIAGWHRAVSVATWALQGSVYAPVGNATHYHADYVVPYWAASMAKVRVIGAHDFYRWPGNWRAATYFSQSYANVEPQQLAAVAAPPIPLDASPVPAGAAGAPAIPARLVADVSASPYGKTAPPPAIDRRPPTLIAGDNAPVLDPKLNRVVVLTADQQRGKLEPSPSLRVRDR